MQSLGIADVVTSRLGRKTLATLLAIVPAFFGIFGLGHIYLGNFRRGAGILVTGIGLILISYPGFMGLQFVVLTDLETITTTMTAVFALVMVGLAAIGLWIWQIFDARKIASQQIEVK